MSYIIRYQEKAVTEYESAIAWYHEHSQDAAENFELSVKEKIDILRITPDIYKRTYKQFHEVSLRKYPFSIIYLIDEHVKGIIISSIYHHKRDPKKKYKM